MATYGCMNEINAKSMMLVYSSPQTHPHCSKPGDSTFSMKKKVLSNNTSVGLTLLVSSVGFITELM